MRRVFILLAALLPAIAAMAVLPAAAQSLPSKEDANALLARVKDERFLAAPGNAPFHLVAKLNYQVGALSMTGVYEVLWDEPGRYREEFRLGHISETDLALDDKLYTRRSTPDLTYAQARVRALTALLVKDEDSPVPVLDANNDPPSGPARVSKVYASNVGGQNLTCLDYATEKRRGTSCLEAATNRPVSNTYKFEHTDFNTSVVEDQFATLGSVVYPGRIVSKLSTETLEITVKTLEFVTQFSDEVFAAPAGSSARAWCAKPDVASRFLKVRPETMDRLAPQELRGFFALVATDGYLETLDEISPAGESKKVRANQYTSARFPIHACSGKPIEYETVFLSVE